MFLTILKGENVAEKVFHIAGQTIRELTPRNIQGETELQRLISKHPQIVASIAQRDLGVQQQAQF